MINSKPIRSHHKTFKNIIEYLVRRLIVPHAKLSTNEIHILFYRPNSLSNDKPSFKDNERSRRDKNLIDNPYKVNIIQLFVRITKRKMDGFSLKSRKQTELYQVSLSRTSKHCATKS